VTNGASQSQPYYGMSMNSYPGKMLSPALLHGRSALGTVGQSAHDHRPSGPPMNRPTPYVEPSGVAPSLPQASQAKPCTTGRSGYNTRPSSPYADHPITKIGLSGCTYTDQDTSSQTQSSCPTTPAAHHSRSMPSPGREVECLSVPTKPEKIQVAELVWHAKAKSAARSPLHSAQKGKSKFTFNVAKCDKIFDELFKNYNIKLSHTIPPIEELKKCVYCKWHGSFLHNTNVCNIFRRQIQSVVDEGRLRFQKMKIDRQFVPVDTLGPVDKKVLVRPYSTDKGKGKNIIIGDPPAPNLTHGVVTQKAPDKRKANKTGCAMGHGAPGMPKCKFFGGEGRDKQKGKRPKVTFEQLLAKYHE
jgi:hypothetical protein